MIWTPERVETLRRLWNEGLSCSQIAAEMGVTRNMVIGKAHRMMLPARTRVPKQYAPRTAVRRTSKWSDDRVDQLKKLKSAGLTDEQIAARFGDVSRGAVAGKAHHLGLQPARPKPAHVVMVEPDESHRLRHDDLHAAACRWPYGDPRDRDFGYCGGKKKDGGSYCAYHHGLAYAKPEPSTPRFRDDRAALRRAAAVWA